jgi:membrane protease YdiL (CAAX protease family)
MMERSKQHSIGQSVLLHLLPGVLITIGYVLITPVLIQYGFPALMGLLIAFLALGLPFQVGFVLYQVRRSEGQLSLQEIIYRNPFPAWQFVALVIGILLWGFLTSGILGIPELYLAENFFSWLPDWFAILSVEQFSGFAKPALVTTFIFVVIVNWFLGPIIEDIYFRGYLLPRLPKNSKWMPMISTALFSLYHFWVPWAFLSRLIAFYPITFVTWKRQNLYFNFAAHLSLNIVGGLLLWIQILG